MKQLAYVKTYRDRHGKVRHYFRRRGFAQIALPGAPGSSEFMAAYDAAMRGETVQKKEPGKEREKPGSMSALIARYYRSAEFVRLRPSTQVTYRGILERFRSVHGHKLVADMERRHVKDIRDKMAKDTPAAANNLLRMIKMLMQFALDEGLRTTDPTVGIKRVRIESDGFHSWTEDEIEAFEAAYPAGSRERLALALLVYTGQRRSDVVLMGRQHVRNGRIRVCQSKTGVELWIPIHPALDAILSQTPATNMTFLMTAHGRPFTAAGFGNWFGAAVRSAGLKECSAHGLRKAAARRLAEAGCTHKQIASITGHQSLKEVERYTRAADQTHLADAAMERLGNVRVSTRPNGLDKTGPNPLERKD